MKMGVGPAGAGCRADVDRRRYEDAERRNREEMNEYRVFGEITDVDPLAETAQGGDRDSDVGGGDFGGENDRAAASTVAE